VTYGVNVVRIGSAPDCEAVLAAPGVAPRHAQIEFVPEACQFHLRTRDGQTFVNGNEVEEVILQDGDKLELGSGGPVVRFRIYAPVGAVCKPVRRMLADARDVASVSGGAAATQTLTRDLLTQATLKLKWGFPLAVVLGAFLAGWLGGWIGRPAAGDLVTRAELEELRRQQARELPADVVRREDFEQLRVEQQKQQENLARLARANAVVRRIQDELSQGVCLLHGVFRLRLADGAWFAPDGEPLEVEYTGSGFRVTEAGHVLTNRHVVAPWLEMPPVMRMVEHGAVPEFVRLTATFPGKAPIPVPVASIGRRQDDLDVAVVQLPADQLQGVPLLPMHDGPRADDDDRRAIVVGYPTGLAAILARADAQLVASLQQRGASMAETIEELAKAGQVTPTITQGVIGNVRETVISYDASTTHGGSGGPVFDGSGFVIAVNFAILRDFSGSNFGVPIRFARELLPR
jgi:S1-C subfamily serine protease